jgi:beta-glucosidase
MAQTWISDETRRRADDLLAQLTLEEKAALTIGHDFWTTRAVERLGLPAIWLADGPHGVRKARSSADPGIGTSLPATCFPTASALASSWNLELVYEIGVALGREAQAQGVQVLLGPGVNLKRSPLGGRNFEYFSEDPVLSGELAAALINGVQSQGVGTTLKHYVANEQETARMIVDSQLDARTLHELYLRPFAIAMQKGRPWSLMAAYNRVNGSYATESELLLDTILKQEWGYEGIVMSDWGAITDRVAALRAGLHLEMPGTPTVEAVVAALREGQLDEARLNTLVRELLCFILTADAQRRPDTTVDLDAHHALARRAAGETIVLLKNQGGLLPLEGERLAGLAVIGAFARTPRYQGSGSSQVVPTRVESIYDELARLSEEEPGYAAGYAGAETIDQALLAEARDVAARASAAVVCVGLPPSYESEGFDRAHIELPPAHNALVEALLEVQPNLVVVLINGSAVAMPWAERAPAIVEGWLSGQAGGGAVADVLLGRINPSGKLSETFPVRLEDTPAYGAFPSLARRARYGEGLLSGYRWYDTRDIAPLFPFGHGLSYTSFAYADLRLDRQQLSDGETLSVSLRVSNTGERAGQEVVQLYLREPGAAGRPDKELRAFAKLALQPGESREVMLALSGADFAVYDEDRAAWVTEAGEREILVGASSRDIRLSARVQFVATNPPQPLLDRDAPIRSWVEHPLGRERIMPLIADQLEHMTREAEQAGESTEMLKSFVLDAPVSKLAARGKISWQALDELIAAVNAERLPQATPRQG